MDRYKKIFHLNTKTLIQAHITKNDKGAPFLTGFDKIRMRGTLNFEAYKHICFM